LVTPLGIATVVIGSFVATSLIFGAAFLVPLLIF
jgi:hypothetical protein